MLLPQYEAEGEKQLSRGTGSSKHSGSAHRVPGKGLSSLCPLITFMITTILSSYYDPHFTSETREVKLPAQEAQPAEI